MFFMWRPPDARRGGSRRSTDRMLTSGGTDARGRFTESSAEWGGRGRPLTPVEAISASSYLAYGGAGRGPPYTKYEGPNHALSGVSGRARPPHSADDSVNLPRASVPPEVSIRPVLLRLPPRLASGGLHIKNMGGERRSRQVICNGYKCPDLKLSAVPGECTVPEYCATRLFQIKS